MPRIINHAICEGDAILPDGWFRTERLERASFFPPGRFLIGCDAYRWGEDDAGMIADIKVTGRDHAVEYAGMFGDGYKCRCLIKWQSGGSVGGWIFHR